jgi:hypothetical protein
MIRVKLGGDWYAYSNGDWYGVSRGARSDFSKFFPGPNTRAPLSIYPNLLSAGLEQGYNRSVFSRKKQEEEVVFDDNTEETEKPRRKSRGKKKKSNSISIF